MMIRTTIHVWLFFIHLVSNKNWAAFIVYLPKLLLCLEIVIKIIVVYNIQMEFNNLTIHL